MCTHFVYQVHQEINSLLINWMDLLTFSEDTLDSCLNFCRVPISRPNIRRFLTKKTQPPVTHNIYYCSLFNPVFFKEANLSGLPLFALFVHGLILNEVSARSLFGGSYYRRLQRRLEDGEHLRKQQFLTLSVFHKKKLLHVTD